VTIASAPILTSLPTPARAGLMLPALSLCKRELVRFLRQRHRIIGALATPLIFWLLIGAGMGRSFAVPGSAGGSNYMEYFFPGTIVMILLFTAIFSTISIIEDRREGFLQGVLVAPVSRMAIVLGKILGGTVLGFLSLRYRSFYGGFVVHVLIALTMDVLSASRAGLF
jgi:ABC-2 type transport system permease protein